MQKVLKNYKNIILKYLSKNLWLIRKFLFQALVETCEIVRWISMQSLPTYIYKINFEDKDSVQNKAKKLIDLRYRPFHKTLPRSSEFVKWISVRFSEMDCISGKMDFSWDTSKTIHNIYKRLCLYKLFTAGLLKLKLISTCT